jgi:DNA (cytosine-5)-methyltransferase 1
VQFNNHCDATSISSPVSAITTSGAHHGLCLPFMLNYHGGNKEGRDGTERAADVNEPMPVIPTENRYGLVLPFLVPHFGEREGQSPRTHDINEPSPTITGQGAGSLVMPYLMDVNHGDDRFGIAMVSLIQTMNELGVVDIGFRMLDPDELSRAQGFPDDYHYHGTRAEQVRQIGNAVCPPVAKALCETIAEAA